MGVTDQATQERWLYGGDPDAVPTQDDITHEHFRTPLWVIDAAIRLITWIPSDCPLRILDAGAGNDARWGVGAKTRWPSSQLTAVEARAVPAAAAVDRWVHASLFDSWDPEPYDLIVTNPPFSRSLDWAQWCIAHCAPGGTILLYMRNAFGHGWRRYSQLHRQQPFAIEGKLVQRPVHEHGSSDRAQEYSCYYWRDPWPNATPDPIIKWLSRVDLPPEQQQSFL